MFNLDPGKLLVIAVVAVLLLGPDRLPQVARQAGGAWKAFNEFRQRMEAEVRSNIPDLPSSGDLARMTSSPSALFDHLEKMGTPTSSAAQDLTGSAETTLASRMEARVAPTQVELDWVTNDVSSVDMAITASDASLN